MLDKVIKTLNEIGLNAILDEATTDGFLKNIHIKQGVIFVNSKCDISAILHEAGHLALLPKQYRLQVSGDVSIIQKKMCKEIDWTNPQNQQYLYADDTEATAWAWAFGKYLDIPEDKIIPKSVYQNNGLDIRYGLKHNTYLGIHGLARAGLCCAKLLHTKVSNLPLYPKLLRFTID